MGEGRIDQRLELSADGIGGGGIELGHENHRDPLHRVDEEGGRIGAAPVILASACGHERTCRVGYHGEAEPETGARIVRLIYVRLVRNSTNVMSVENPFQT